MLTSPVPAARAAVATGAWVESKHDMYLIHTYVEVWELTLHTDIHTYCTMDSGDRLFDSPRVEVGPIFVRQRSFLPLRPSGSSRMVEASQLAGNDGGR